MTLQPQDLPLLPRWWRLLIILSTSGIVVLNVVACVICWLRGDGARALSLFIVLPLWVLNFFVALFFVRRSGRPWRPS